MVMHLEEVLPSLVLQPLGSQTTWKSYKICICEFKDSDSNHIEEHKINGHANGATNGQLNGHINAYNNNGIIGNNNNNFFIDIFYDQIYVINIQIVADRIN